MGYLKTGEVARLFHVTTSTIRNWTDRGVLKCEITSGGTRVYQSKDIEQVLDIWNKFHKIMRGNGIGKDQEWESR